MAGKVGRPKSASARRTPRMIRVDDRELEAITDAARGIVGVPVSVWVRAILIRAAQSSRFRERAGEGGGYWLGRENGKRRRRQVTPKFSDAEVLEQRSAQMWDMANDRVRAILVGASGDAELRREVEDRALELAR